MVQCERRKNTKQYQGHAAAQKSAAWPAERHNTSGAYPAGAPAFLRLCIYVFCAAPLKLRHSRRDRRTAAAPGGCRGRITSVRAAYCTARKKNAARRAGTQNFMCKIPVCHASLFRRCRRVLPAWCRPPGTPAVGASAESFDAARFGTLPKTGYLPSSSPFVAVGKPMGKQRFPLRCCKRARRFIATWNIKPPGVVKPAPRGSVHFHQPCPKAGAVQADDAGHGDVVYHKGDVAHQEQQPRERDAHALEFLDNGADGKQK